VNIKKCLSCAEVELSKHKLLDGFLGTASFVSASRFARDQPNAMPGKGDLWPIQRESGLRDHLHTYDP
jgi:hypothetical protein